MAFYVIMELKVFSRLLRKLILRIFILEQQ